jgi:tripartite-type tricarboxylate transporter receptor subunit TctC
MTRQDLHPPLPVSPARRRLLLASGVAALGLHTSLDAHAQQDFPKSPVKIIVPFGPGGPTDTVARLIGQKLQETWNQPVIVDYKPGAGTTIGADFVAKSPPDGLVLGLVNSSFAVNPALRKNLPYDTVKDLAGVTQIANLQLAVVARPDAPFNTLPELIAYAKKNPGKLTYGTPGAGGTAHLGVELLKRDAGFDMLHAPFKGSAPAHTELMGGRIDLVVDPFLSVQPYVKAGRMKMIATMGDKRVEGFDYPTVAETLPGFQVNALLGFVAPRATPRPVVEKIQQDIARILRQPEMKKRIEEQGMTVVASTPTQFDAFVQSEMKRYARIVSDAGIQAE